MKCEWGNWAKSLEGEKLTQVIKDLGYHDGFWTLLQDWGSLKMTRIRNLEPANLETEVEKGQSKVTPKAAS